MVAVECIFTWYWLADLCAREGIPFVLGHALYMKAIHGGKAKNDRIDAHKIAALLRGGMLPQAYVYPAGMRATRDLLRRRLHLVRKRGQLLAHIQMTNHQYNLPALGKRIAYPSNREGVAEHFADRVVRKSIAVDLALLERYDALITDLELYLVRQAKQHDPQAFHAPALDPRHRQGAGADDPLRDPRHASLRSRAGVRLLRPAGQVREGVGRARSTARAAPRWATST